MSQKKRYFIDSYRNVQRCYEGSMCSLHTEHFGTVHKAREVALFSAAPVESRTEFGKLLSGNKGKKKGDTCRFCSSTKFMNSHTIPENSVLSILAGIDGHVLTTDFFAPSLGALDSSVTSMTFNNWRRGTGNAMCFKLLCQTCDETLFTDYENAIANDAPLTQHMMKEIALKSTLFELWELRAKEETLNLTSADVNDPNLQSQLSFMGMRHQIFSGGNSQSIKAADREIDLLRLRLDNDDEPYIKLFHKVLPYVTPIAAQGYAGVSTLPGHDFQGVNNTPRPTPFGGIAHPVHPKVWIVVTPSKAGHTKVSLFTDHSTYAGRWQAKAFSDEAILQWIWDYLVEISEELFVASPYANDRFLKGKSSVNPLIESNALSLNRLTRAIDWRRLSTLRDSIHTIP